MNFTNSKNKDILKLILEMKYSLDFYTKFDPVLKILKKRKINYSWDGNPKVFQVIKPEMNLEYLSPGSSEGLINQDFSFCDISGSQMNYSIFINCDFSYCIMKDCKIKESLFINCNFYGATGFEKQKMIIDRDEKISSVQDYIFDFKYLYSHSESCNWDPNITRYFTCQDLFGISPENGIKFRKIIFLPLEEIKKRLKNSSVKFKYRKRKPRTIRISLERSSF